MEVVRKRIAGNPTRIGANFGVCEICSLLQKNLPSVQASLRMPCGLPDFSTASDVKRLHNIPLQENSATVW